MQKRMRQAGSREAGWLTAMHTVQCAVYQSKVHQQDGMIRPDQNRPDEARQDSKENYILSRRQHTPLSSNMTVRIVGDAEKDS